MDTVMTMIFYNSSLNSKLWAHDFFMDTVKTDLSQLFAQVKAMGTRFLHAHCDDSDLSQLFAK